MTDIVVDGYRGDMVRGELRACFPRDWFTFIRNEEWDRTNNAFSLFLARYPEQRPMLLLDGDSVFDPAVLDRVLEDPRANRLALRAGDVDEEEMKVRVDSRGAVVGLGKEIPPHEAAASSTRRPSRGHPIRPDRIRGGGRCPPVRRDRHTR